MAETDVQKIIENRDSIYGGFENNAAVCKQIQEVIARNWQGEMTPQVEYGLDIICQKIARITTGDAGYVDNWVDLAGYATLVAECVNPEHPRGK